MILLEREYSAEELVDLSEHVWEAIDSVTWMITGFKSAPSK